MYSRRNVALVFHDYTDERTVLRGIETAPVYVDRIYVLGSHAGGDAPEPLWAEVPLRKPDLVVYKPGGNATPIARAAAYQQLIIDGMDAAVIIIGDSFFDLKILPYLLDPIVWGEADFVRGIKHLMPAVPETVGDEERKSSAVFIEQTRIRPVTSEPTATPRLLPSKRGIAAVSRDGLEVLWQALLKERFWKTLVAVPCYNEGLMIASVVLRSRGFVDDVLVVDDGSSDRTAITAKEAGAIVITHKTNRGYGGALKTCFGYARDNGYDVMVILDGDGQHDPANIPDMLQKMRESGADIVIGSRFLGEQVDMPFYRRIGLRVLDRATRSSGGAPTTDTQCGYRAYGPKAIEQIALSDDSMGAGSEILAVAQENGLTVDEVPIRVRYDLEDTSSQNAVVHGVDVMSSIGWRLMTRRPVSFIALPGFLLTFAGIYGLVVSLQSLIDGQAIPAGTMFAGLLILICGTVALFMGLTIAMLGRLKRA